MHAAVSQLAAAFRNVAKERMAGVPLVNETLSVEAVGFTEWDGRLLGVLVAPWFMNLVLLPGTVAKLISEYGTNFSAFILFRY